MDAVASGVGGAGAPVGRMGVGGADGVSNGWRGMTPRAREGGAGGVEAPSTWLTWGRTGTKDGTSTLIDDISSAGNSSTASTGAAGGGIGVTAARALGGRGGADGGGTELGDWDDGGGSERVSTRGGAGVGGGIGARLPGGAAKGGTLRTPRLGGGGGPFGSSGGSSSRRTGGAGGGGGGAGAGALDLSPVGRTGRPPAGGRETELGGRAGGFWESAIAP